MRAGGIACWLRPSSPEERNSIVDVFRRRYSGGATVGWLALIVLLPFIGAVIYWVVRKPSQEEIDQAYLGQAELRRSAAARPFDSTGM